MSRSPNTLTSVSDWRSQFSDIGLSPGRVDALSKYAGLLSSRGFPVVFSFHHLCRLLGRNPRYLASVVFSPQSHYRSFDIPKRTGGTRTIDAPYPLLLECQRWISSNILSKIKISGVAHGYVDGRSILSNAMPHLGKEMLLKIDIRNFFPSIPITRVIGLFKDIGYAPEVAFFLGRICCCQDALPQGAATSPVLSNILLRYLDKRLVGLARKHDVTYTRYADDLVFSGADITLDFTRSIEVVLNDSGFEINLEKKILVIGARRKIVTGIDISSGVPRVPRAYRRAVRMEAHLAIRLGALDYVLSRGKNPRVLDELAGKLQYWLQIEPANIFASKSLQAVRDMSRNFGTNRGRE